MNRAGGTEGRQGHCARDVDKHVRPPLRLPQWAKFQGAMPRHTVKIRYK